MRSSALAAPGLLLIEHQQFDDARGAFFESWNEREFAAAGLGARFVQENVSVSKRWVLRGLHYQIHHTQGKLVRVLAGEIFDVVVDLRRSSPHFGRSCTVSLSAREPRSLWVPEGFAHGFLALADDTPRGIQSDGLLGTRRRAHARLARCGTRRSAGRCRPDVTPILSAKDAHGEPLARAETFA